MRARRLGLMRTTTSSRKPMIGVRATASMRPSRRAACGGAVDDAPLALGDHRQRGIVGRLRRRIRERLDIGIGRALLLGGLEARIGDRIGVARAKPRQHLVARRIDRIGGDVVNPRQPVGLMPR